MACMKKHRVTIKSKSGEPSSYFREQQPDYETIPLSYTCPEKGVLKIYGLQVPKWEAKKLEDAQIIDVEVLEGGSGQTGRDPTREDNALFEYGKKALTETIDVIKNFIALMIPLTTGLITVYFALLEFLGIENADQAESAIIGIPVILIPEFLLITSLIAFIGASFPVPKNLAIGNIKSILNYRNAAIRWKYSWIIIGCAFFLAGIIYMVIVVVEIV